MKKFLTVLLALSVVFTYTVGTAFAAAPNPASENAVDSEKAFLEVVQEVKNSVEYNGKDFTTLGDEPTDTDSYYLSKVAVNYAIDETVKPVVQAIRSAESNWDAEWADFAEATEFNDLNVNLTKAFAKQYHLDYAALKVAMAPDLSGYSAEDRVAINKFIDAKDDAIKGYYLSDATVDAPNANINSLKTRITVFRDAVDAIKTEMEKYTPAATAEEKLAQAKNDALAALNEVVEVFTEKAEDAYKESVNASDVAKFETLYDDINRLVDLYDEKIDEIYADEDMTFTEKMEALENIEETYVVATFAVTPNFDEFYDDLKILEDADVLVAYAENYAADLKDAIHNTTSAFGTPVYDAADVDVALTKVKEAIAEAAYKAVTIDSAVPDINLVKETFKNELKPETFYLAKYKEDAIETFAGGNYDTTDVANSAWTGDRYDEVVAIQDKAIDEILVATSIEDIDAIAEQAKEAIDAILTDAEVDALTRDTNKRISALDYEAAFYDYFRVMVGTTDYSKAIKDDAVANAKQVLIDAVIATENPDLTYAEIDKILKDNYEKALAELTKVNTTKELEEAALAVDTLINALPSTITMADKEAVLAAQKAFEDYLDMPGADDADVSYTVKLKNAVVSLINLETKELKKLVRALPAKITVADADKVEALRTLIDDLEATYGDYDNADRFGDETGFDYQAPLAFSSYINNVKTAEAALEVAKVKDATDKIAALGANPTKAEVEAARAAYDALKLRSKLNFNDELYADLLRAEKALVTAEINAVKSLKIVKNHSVAGKGYIKIAWSTIGDDSVVDGYRVYRSTKKDSGYGTKPIFTTTGKTYKNTKDLKKGTRYYYKVRAYKVVDGKTYFSAYSNKAHRVAK